MVLYKGQAASSIVVRLGKTLRKDSLNLLRLKKSNKKRVILAFCDVESMRLKTIKKIYSNSHNNFLI